MRDVSCVKYTPRAWDARSLQPKLIDPLYFGIMQRLRSDKRLISYFKTAVFLIMFMFITGYTAA